MKHSKCLSFLFYDETEEIDEIQFWEDDKDYDQIIAAFGVEHRELTAPEFKQLENSIIAAEMAAMEIYSFDTVFISVVYQASCDACVPAMIQGCFCHEHGCPNARKL